MNSPGNEIAFWWSKASSFTGPTDTPIAFTSAMTEWLGRLSACVIGVSGTGSIVAEQLGRLGFGEIILIDFDKIEHRNLNRILNSTLDDAENATFKVEMMAKAIQRYRSNCDVITISQSVAARDAVIAAAGSDVLFSCVDTAEGRHIADRLSAFFAIPLFDVGVSIPTRKTADGGRAIAEVCGRVDYVYPGGSSLLDRGIYTSKTLEAEYLARAAPEAFRQKIADGYLQGMSEQAPAVITLNMRAASACVMEFIARAFPFRHESNRRYAQSIFMLADGEEEHRNEDSFARKSSFPIAAGLTEPLLGLPNLSLPRVIQ
ncbi:MAG: HesA/MoeB/ThiF family protein [Rhodomicrobium sp.]